MPEIGPGTLKRRATARDHTDDIISFIQRLTGGIHPALDSSEKSAVTVVGLDTDSGQLIFDHPNSIIEPQQPTQSASDDSQRNNPAEPDSHFLEPISQDDLNDTYAQCRETEKSLRQQMEKHQLESGKRLTDLSQTHSYEDVDNALAEFAETIRLEEKEYKTTALKGFLGHIRRGFRAFSSNSSNLKVFTALIPSQESYLSVLCGGLTFLCAVGKRMSEIREALSQFLQELVAILQNKGKIMEIFSENLELHRLNAGLCVSILHVMHEFIDWVKTSPGIKALMKPADYKEKVLEKIRTMEQNARDFKTMAKICGLRDVREMRKAQARFEQGQLKRQEQKTILNYVFLFIKDDPAQASAPDSKPDRSSRPHRRRHRHPHPRAEAETLLQTYAHDHTLITTDCHALLQLRYTLSKPEQSRAVALLHDPSFQSLTTTLAPRRLLVHGCSQEGTSAGGAATSFVAARLFDLVSRHAGPTGAGAGSASASVIPLAFFCGRHVDGARDPNAHAPGMMLTLLLQLIEQARGRGVRLRSGRMREELRGLDAADVGSIGAVWRAAVGQLPGGTVVFVVVDGVDAYEDDERRAELKVALGCLLEMGGGEEDGEGGGEGGGGVVVKLLVTAPCSTLSVWRLFEDCGMEGAEVVQLPSVCSAQGGFAALEWEDLSEDGGLEEMESGED
ncbi:uncharacterized protein BKCO1_5900053 [Diplodia corticola]|uniref:Fungal STAND N-terminal Goodbye domain-containing protein n=1 Tax=Diplodia corticola TaxID=236234 RepID=A0A1J9QPX5_9PEZI|nr:uncharacterized protein BKCO1_5900053 [Diplodia corticola]OJD30512.1 hypothetical protein BKCO1_5900053 [Diplodia corticola]